MYASGKGTSQLPYICTKLYVFMCVHVHVCVHVYSSVHVYDMLVSVSVLYRNC